MCQECRDEDEELFKEMDMANEPTPRTLDQAEAEVAALKAKLSKMVPSEEKEALEKDLAAAKEKLAALEAAAAAPPAKSGFFPRLF